MSAPFPDQLQTTKFTREVSDISLATSPASSSTLTDFEGLPPVSPRTKNPSRLSVFSWFASIVHRHPFLFAVFLYAVFTGFVASVAKSSYDRDKRDADVRFGHVGDGLAILGTGYQIDTTSKMLSISWKVQGCGTYAQAPYYGPFPYAQIRGCTMCGREVDVYFNDASKPTFSYDPGNIPFFPVYDPIFPPPGALITFNVDHGVDYIDGTAPFDGYHFTAFVFAIEKVTNKSVPIVVFAAGDGPENFILSSVEQRMNSTWTYDSVAGPTTVVVESSVVEITVKRSQLAQAFTVCLLLVNAALAAGSVYVTLLVFVRREGVNDALLLLPVTTILTIPALRALYVGSPPFGIYLDTFGFFSQMMIVAVCSMILLYMVDASTGWDRRTSHGGGKGCVGKILNSLFPEWSDCAA